MMMRDDPLYKEGKRAARAWIETGVEARQNSTAYQAGFDDELRRKRYVLKHYELFAAPCCESCPNQDF
jgi:hypothetical protein